MAGEAVHVPERNTLHIAPGYSAGGSLEVAIRDARRDDEMLKWPDDLSCDPIDPGTPEQRDKWLDYGDWDLAGSIRQASLRSSWPGLTGWEPDPTTSSM